MSDLYSYNDWREFLEHREKSAYGSFTWLPGGKNSSEYNHVYYLNNKWRWGIGGDMDPVTTVRETKGLVQSILDSTDLDERIAKGVKDVLDKTDIDDKIIAAAQNSRVGRAISETKNVKRQLDNINNQIKNGNRNPDLLRAQSEAKSRYEQTLGGKIEKNLKSIKPAMWVRSGKAGVALRDVAKDINNNYVEKEQRRIVNNILRATGREFTDSGEFNRYLQRRDYKNLHSLITDAIVKPITDLANGKDIKTVVSETVQRVKDSFDAKDLSKQYDAERNTISKVDSHTGFKLKNRDDYTIEEDMKRVNPNYKNWGDETKQNCMLCTATYDLRRRGYDVTAQTTGLGFNGEYDLEEWYPGSLERYKKTDSWYDYIDNFYRYDSSKQQWVPKLLEDREYSKSEFIHNHVEEMFNTLDSYPNGARGYLQVSWNGGGGHALAWEIQNGQVVIIDAQSGKTYTESSAERTLFQQTNGVFGYVRLDDLDFDKNAIKRVAKS